MSQTETPPASPPEAPAPPTPARAVPEAPPAAPAAPAPRSTGGDLTNGRPAPRPIERRDAQDVLRRAYAGALREPGQQQQQADAQAGAQARPPAGREEAPAPPAAPAAPAPAVDQVAGRERGPDGRFLPAAPARAAGRVDAAPAAGVQEAQQPAPAAGSRQTPPPATAPAGTPRRAPPEAPEASAPAEPTPEPAAAAPDTGTAEPPAPDLASPAWQRAFAAQPGLRRTVDSIHKNPQLRAAQKADLLADKLTAALRVADANDLRAQQMQWLRDNRPNDFIAQLRAEEEQQRVQTDLEQRISAMIAEAYEIPADDPEFQGAGAGPDDDYATGLAKFVDVTSRRSPVVRRQVEQALAQQQAEHAKEMAAVQAQHKLDVAAALERGRAQGRAPGRAGGVVQVQPRATGAGVRPVGQDDGPGGGPQVPRRVPDVGTYRGAFALGYQQREPT